VFLPGVGEIRAAQRQLLGARLTGPPVAVLPLHGMLGPAEQDEALRPQPGPCQTLYPELNPQPATTCASSDARVIRMELYVPDACLTAEQISLRPPHIYVSTAEVDQTFCGNPRPLPSMTSTVSAVSLQSYGLGFGWCPLTAHSWWTKCH